MFDCLNKNYTDFWWLREKSSKKAPLPINYFRIFEFWNLFKKRLENDFIFYRIWEKDFGEFWKAAAKQTSQECCEYELWIFPRKSVRN